MISIVVPAYNEADSLDPLYSELNEVLTDLGRPWEIVFVDDGSRDATWAKIAALSALDPRVRGIRFRRNFGKAAALSAAFATVKGELVFTLDADLQDDPHEIPRFLEHASDKYDVVSGYKRTRHDPWHKVYPSRVFNWMVSRLTGVKLHDHNCGFKLYRREVLGEVTLYGELHRFVPVLAAARGFRVGEIVVNHRARKFGYSKFGVERFIKGFLDLLTVAFLTGFGQRPQHILGSIGLGSFALGLLGMVYLTIYWLIAQALPSWNLLPLHDRPLLLYSVAALLLGGQLMSMGLIAEMITSLKMQQTDAFSISERTPDRSPGDPTDVPSGEHALDADRAAVDAARGDHPNPRDTV